MRSLNRVVLTFDHSDARQISPWIVGVLSCLHNCILRLPAQFPFRYHGGFTFLSFWYNPERARTACTAKNSGGVGYIVINHHYLRLLVRDLSHALYFLPHDYHMILSSLSHYLCLSLLFLSISDGILSDLHHSLRHTLLFSYLFHTHPTYAKSS